MFQLVFESFYVSHLSISVELSRKDPDGNFLTLDMCYRENCWLFESKAK